MTIHLIIQFISSFKWQMTIHLITEDMIFKLLFSVLMFKMFYLISNLFLPASPPFMLFIFATQLL